MMIWVNLVQWLTELEVSCEIIRIAAYKRELELIKKTHVVQTFSTAAGEVEYGQCVEEQYDSDDSNHYLYSVDRGRPLRCG